MQIVIDISEARFRDIQRIAEVQFESKYFKTAEQIIANGTPLPKGHGDLVDSNDLSLITVHLIDGVFVCDAPTIIEADKKSESEESE